jgi:hypothetical protein
MLEESSDYYLSDSSSTASSTVLNNGDEVAEIIGLPLSLPLLLDDGQKSTGRNVMSSHSNNSNSNSNNSSSSSSSPNNHNNNHHNNDNLINNNHHNNNLNYETVDEIGINETNDCSTDGSKSDNYTSESNDLNQLKRKNPVGRRKLILSAREKTMRRLESNERERLRMHSLNEAFQVTP